MILRGGRRSSPGNKRLSWIAVRLFYRLNDAAILPTPDAAFDLVASVASGDRYEVTEIATTLTRWRTPSE